MEEQIKLDDPKDTITCPTIPAGWQEHAAGKHVVWDYFWRSEVYNLKTKKYKSMCQRCNVGMGLNFIF